jgi:DNA-binding SARP family transcriptional activator
MRTMTTVRFRTPSDCVQSFRSMWDVEVRLLGPVELRVDGLLVPIERVQVRRLLAVLTMRPGALLSTDELIEELWPGELPQSPRAALRVVASRLRGALSRHASRLKLSGDAYQLDVDHSAVDLATFYALLAAPSEGGLLLTSAVVRIDTALALWHGRPFGGAQGPPSLDRETTRLERSRIAALAHQAEMLIESQSFDRAVILLAPVVEEDPTDERAAAVLATALARTGRRTDALAVLHRTRRTLLEGHGLDPNGQLAATEQAILSTPEVSSGVAAAPRVRARAQPWLYGRDDVVEPLVGWFARPPTTGGARCVLVEGPAGIGKSAVAVAIAERLGGHTIHAHCDPDLADAESVAAVLGVSSTVRTGDARGRALALVDALIDRLTVLAGNGDVVTVVVDDLQWATEVEVRFLLRAVRTSGLDGLALVVTSRDAEADVDPVLRRLLDKLSEHDEARRVQLRPLDGEATRAVYAAWGGRTLTAPGAAALLELSGGLPYLVRAMAMTGQDPTTINPKLVTDHLRDTIAARLSHLDQSAMRIVSAAAVLGRVVDLPVLAATCGTDVSTIAAAIDDAVRVGVLTTGGGSCRFDHELTRLHLAQNVGPATTCSLNQAAAIASLQVGRDAIVVAHHVLGAGVLNVGADAVRTLLAGADLAVQRGSFGDAARFLARAAELEPDDARRLDIQRRQAWALECEGDRPGAELLIDEVFAEARQRGLSYLMARAALAGGAFGAVVGGDRRRLKRLEETLEHPPEDERLRLDVVAAMILELDSADRPIPPQLLAAVEELAADDDTRLVRLGVNWRTMRRAPASLRIVGDAEEYVAAARQTGDPPRILEAEELLAKTRLMIGDLDGAERAHADLARTVRRHRWPRYIWSSALMAATLTDLRHGSAAAEEPARKAMTIGREHGVDDAINAHGMFRISVMYRHGGLAEFEPLVRAATQSRADVPAWHAVLAASLADGGDCSGAAREVAWFLESANNRATAFQHIGVTFAIRAGCTIGDTKSLATCVDWLLPWSGNLLLAGVGAACYGPADSALAEALTALGDDRASTFAQAGQQLLATAGATAWSTAG